MARDFSEDQPGQTPWWRRFLGYIVNPRAAAGAQRSSPLDMGMHVYVARVPGEGLQEIVSLLSEEIVFRHGLVPQAMVGKLLKRSDEGGALTPSNFAANTSFKNCFHDVIARYAPEHPDLRAEAQRLGSGRVYVIDGRTPTPQGDVPPIDIVGSFRVQDGIVQSGSYERNPNHLLFTADGFFQLDAALHERLLAELTTLCVRNSVDPAQRVE